MQKIVWKLKTAQNELLDAEDVNQSDMPDA
jgi:hypothetical protein